MLYVSGADDVTSSDTDAASDSDKQRQTDV